MLSRSWVSEVEFKETIWESGRTTIIQVYCKETKQMKKLKFFDISRLTQVEVAFYLDAIATINYRHNQRREVTSSFYRNH